MTPHLENDGFSQFELCSRKVQRRFKRCLSDDCRRVGNESQSDDGHQETCRFTAPHCPQAYFIALELDNARCCQAKCMMMLQGSNDEPFCEVGESFLSHQVNRTTP